MLMLEGCNLRTAAISPYLPQPTLCRLSVPPSTLSVPTLAIRDWFWDACTAIAEVVTTIAEAVVEVATVIVDVVVEVRGLGLRCRLRVRLYP